MAESTLSTTRSEILQAVGDFFGYTRNPHVWTREETAQITRVVRSGERQFYSPPPVGGVTHTWSFLRPRLRITISAPYATGTVGISSGTVTLTGGTWPEWAADGHLVVDGVGYAVASRTSNSVLVLDDTSVTVASGTDYALQRWQYTLPDDFGGFIDAWLAYTPENNQREAVALVSVPEILRMRQQAISVASPRAAVTPVNSTTASAGQRFELLVFPTPTQAGTLEATYYAIPNQATDALPYPLGGQVHAETVLQACLAAAELERDKRPGPHKLLFLERLAASITHDKKIGPRYLGFNGDGCDDWRFERCATGDPTYGGVSLNDWA